MNPLNQFIEIAPDCTLKQALVPQQKGGKQSVATIEYALLHGAPYGHTLQAMYNACKFHRPSCGHSGKKFGMICLPSPMHVCVLRR